MLATTLGIEFDPNKDWDEREVIYKMSHKIINSYNITARTMENVCFLRYSFALKRNVTLNAVKLLYSYTR